MITVCATFLTVSILIRAAERKRCDTRLQACEQSWLSCVLLET